MKKSLPEKLHLSLDELIAKTEEIYLKLGNRLPELLRELQTGFDESNQLVSYFLNNHAQSEQHAGYGLVADIIQETRQVIEESSTFFLEMKARDEILFESISSGIERVSGLEQTIHHIREDSIEMELISLNAMTAALKAGRAGKAFSYITEELKKLSTHTISYTEELTERGTQVLDLLIRYRETVQRIQSFQNNFFVRFSEQLNTSFETYKRGVKKLAEILFGIIEEAKKVKQPLIIIMEAVQLQDIIKQSIQHVQISLEEIEEEPPGGESVEVLNELSMRIKLLELSVALLDDVKTKLTGSLNLFRENLAQLQDILTRAEQERKVFLEFLTEAESEELHGGAINQMFAESVGALQELLAGIEKSLEDKQRISQDGGHILKGLQQLEESFRNFFEIVDRFYSIEVASKIEIAKEETLKDRQDTVKEMNDLTQRIEKDIKAAVQTLQDSQRRSIRIITRYTDKLADELSLVRRAESKIRESYERLVFSKNTLADTIKSFSVYTDHFFELLNSSRGDMERLAELVAVIESIQGLLQETMEKGRRERMKVLEASGLGQWTGDTSRIQEMIERFTIFTHKKAAGALGGFEVEEGSSPGELTLF